MNPKASIKANQTPLDISIQEYGTVEAVMDFVVANGLSLTDALTPGAVLELATSEQTNTDIRNYFKQKQLFPASLVSTTFTGTAPNVNYATTVSKPSNKVTVSAYQSIMDIALQERGTIESVMALCELNGIGITDALTAGQELLKEVAIEDIEILTYYKAKGIKPATWRNVAVDSGYTVPLYVLENYWV